MKRALVLSLAVVFGLGIAAFAQELTGAWSSSITIDPGTDPVDINITSELTINYSLSGWTFTSYSALTEGGWVAQIFSASGSLGAFSLGSTLDLDPAGAFNEWDVTAGVSIAGVTFGLDFALADNDVELTLSGSGTAGLVTVGVDVTFGGITRDANGVPLPGEDNNECDLPWSGVAITVGFPFCCADVAGTLAFDCDGFSSACFEVDGIAIPNLPWVAIGAELCFELQTKTLQLAPSFDFGDIACFDLYIYQNYDGNLHLGDIYIGGIGLECEIGGVAFTGISIWDANIDKPSVMGDYWEYYNIATTDEGCCGPFAFDVSIFFDDDHNSLFDVDKFAANMSLQVATQFTFSMGIELEVDAGFTLWTLGFDVVW
jgi:hypothetical protein